MTKDLTRGSPLKLILSFGLPLLLGNLFQQLYNVVDTAIVGKTLGSDALAAVGSTGSVNFLIVGFCSGICGGFAIPIAQQFGAGEHDELRRSVACGVLLCGAFCTVLTTLTVVFCEDILRVMNTPEDIFVRATSYIITIFAGLPAYFLFNFCAGVLRSLGDSGTPVRWLIAASIVNVVLDIVFILCLGLDVFGAALATVISQLLAGVGCLVKMCRGFPILKLRRSDWTWSWERCRNLCLMGLPMGLQYSITAIGSVTLQAAVNGLGTSVVAAITAANKVSMFLVCPFDAMGATMATYGGQNTGAGKLDRLNKGMGTCIMLGAIWSAAALGIILLFSDQLVMLFLDEESMSLIPLCRRFLVFNGSFYFPLALVNIVRFLIQGMGFSPLATMAGVFELAARACVALLVPVYGFTAACAASPAAWVLADLFLLPSYFFCVRRLQSASKTGSGRLPSEKRAGKAWHRKMRRRAI